jgi:aminopeptidase N
LRGTWTTPARAWWDVTFYDLHVAIQPKDTTIKGWNRIVYKVLQPATEMQIDLMEPLVIDSMVQNGRAVQFRREGNAFLASLTAPQTVGASNALTVYYHGRPIVARRPPWEGGISLSKDSLGRPFIVTTDQGVGASIWWPNKDTQADEPDSQRIAITVPKPLTDVSNGRLRKVTNNKEGTRTFEWFVSEPINNYAIVVNTANYAHYTDVYDGENGKLTLDYWPLDYHVDAAKRQWSQVKPMLQCFEKWFGPFPWYEDGFKMVETSHLGMEHQSAIAYGNKFQNGYLGRDRSSTGIGMKWDFIIVHEAAHEWWGNNVTTKDVADMWVHESFGNYAENLFTECQQGKEAAANYTIGQRQIIQNDVPIIGTYGVNKEGSGDMYDKGGNMLHMIRQIVNDDEKWRSILRGIQSTFARQTIMGKQVEDYISEKSGINFSKVFDQYLRTTMIPSLEWRIDNDTLRYRWVNAVDGFDMPVRVTLKSGTWDWIKPTRQWKSSPIAVNADDFEVDRNFYVGRIRD